jgi:membrane-associated phospholipid phosphatase
MARPLFLIAWSLAGTAWAVDGNDGFLSSIYDFGNDTVVDAGRTVIAPLSWDGGDWLLFGGCAAAIGVSAITADHDIRIEAQENRNQHGDRYATYANTMGTVWSLGVLAGSAGYGWIADDAQARHAARDGLEATIIASVLIGPIVKWSVGRQRPDQDTDGADDFHHFSGNSSFPSGHATQAFAIATVMARTWSDQWYVAALAYGVAASVGYARINDNQHYLSDVIAGAALGTAVGWAVVGWNQDRRGLRVEPMAGVGFGGVRVAWVF